MNKLLDAVRRDAAVQIIRKVIQSGRISFADAIGIEEDFDAHGVRGALNWCGILNEDGDSYVQAPTRQSGLMFREVGRMGR